MDTNVKLEIFEGPLDLLLHLIRKNEVDISDIPIAMITGQYLEYLRLMEEINIAIAGEFMVMASTLVLIKTKMMLPLQNLEGEEPGEDPRSDLLQQLKERARMQGAVRYLEGKPWLGRDVFSREGGPQELAGTKRSEEIVPVGMFELVSAFQRLLHRRGQQLTLKLLPLTRVSLEERMSQLLARLRQEKSLTFEEFFQNDYSKDDLVVTFLALLELGKQGMLSLYQERLPHPEGDAGQWGVIRIHFSPLAADEAQDEPAFSSADGR